MKFVIASALFICLMRGIATTDYCDPSLCGEDETHIACDNDGDFLSDCPDDARLLEIDEEAQDILVAAHNAVREEWASGQGKVPEKACRMATVHWDDELASLAELNVKQCKMEHDECHSTKEYPNSGQNLFYTGYKGGNPPDLNGILEMAVKDWAEEGDFVDEEILAEYPDNYEGPTIGHFTMVAQELNVAVGCAVSNYVNERGFNTFLVACNYATTNFITLPVYRACSSAGEECTSGPNPEYPALCSSDEDVVYN
ncbi:antigen 5 like allergen Cul n 1 [Drosophila sulfurigaster albostrigata]|uniref:Antigen 5 like allergen Cul n 1 n=1 Tax=Drosophila albomicans TaxID=7291 RepID=A0A6P8ZFQ2_DROAB|nr:antigen 5 like allergen Cul n 1 [Drosophila albomicans]XP_060663100.1 antigen 5 like allergen Cul n 1 [Drosophila nasuta]XP_062139586.1 antigen 5 like allergen Cul n 1 [Drosophila sulfurigaster albostrigata]